jgi:hypothetical protein
MSYKLVHKVFENMFVTSIICGYGGGKEETLKKHKSKNTIIPCLK